MPSLSAVAVGEAEGYSVAPGVLTNDTDADGDRLTAVLISGVAHGALSLGSDGSFRYTPAAGYTGADSFQYAPRDGVLTGAAVTVSLTVEDTARPGQIACRTQVRG